MTQAPDSPDQTTRRWALRPATFYTLVLLVLATDQATKWWVQRSMQFSEERPILGQAFLLYLTQNTGGAWGMLPTGNGLFIGIAVVAIACLLYAYYRSNRGSLLAGAAFALALGGALGNLVDRLRYHYVVDFFYIKAINWPIFNIADSAITLGVVMLLAGYVAAPRRHSAHAPPAEPAPSGD